MWKLLALCALASACVAADPELGAPAPPLTFDALLQAPTGTLTSWEALRGNVVVLEFWATWCGGCRAQIPHLNTLAERYRNRPVRFISVTDEESGIVQRFLKDYPISGWIGLDSGEQTFRRYNITGRPRTVLVDAAGVVRGMGPPAGLNGEILEDLLAGRPTTLSEATVPAAPQALPDPLYQTMLRPAGSVAMTGFGPGAVSGKPGKRWTNWGVSLRRLLAQAHNIPENRIIAPAWAEKTLYDVDLSAPTLTEELRVDLLRRCLDGTFQVKAHKESRSTDVYELRRRPGVEPLLRPVSSRSGRRWGNPTDIKALALPVSSIAGIVSDALGKVVFDETGLQGRFDFELKWDSTNPTSIIDAVRTQLGLDLVPTQHPLVFLVVDSAVQPQSW